MAAALFPVSIGYTVACPTCGADPQKSCRTLKTRRVTDTHRARIDAQYSTSTTGRG